MQVGRSEGKSRWLSAENLTYQTPDAVRELCQEKSCRPFDSPPTGTTETTRPDLRFSETCPAGVGAFKLQRRASTDKLNERILPRRSAFNLQHYGTGQSCQFDSRCATVPKITNLDSAFRRVGGLKPCGRQRCPLNVKRIFGNPAGK